MFIHVALLTELAGLIKVGAIKISPLGLRLIRNQVNAEDAEDFAKVRRG